MAHHHHLLLPLILVQILFLILPSSSSHAATQAIFSQPLQLLFGGQSLTDGDLTLSLSNDCGLILHKASIPVLDFNTSTTTSYCALFVSEDGQLILTAKLGIFGPAIWNNGVTPKTFFDMNKPSLDLNHEELKTAGSTDYILFSGNIATGSANGDVVIAQNGNISTVITKKCALAVKDDTGKTIWSTWPTSAEPTQCFLELTSHGELLLQGYNESGVYTQWKGGYTARENLYVCLLRYFGRIAIYGLKTWLYQDGSSSAGAVAAVVAEKIKMVTA
ncbi:uncharacterized protein LOC120253013 [Dioscorea cayenensis subsp. rotundata]|uniref:Uncharacterized protein LOC120253013 n=1 Tax=Dioscorea cayennensis subsp. rotundata TaxID=55577 RepID=A0AB40AQ70_DIOCR|nr:uncharacterized protein LOC120253013 [Dioscorea cayenensis subsp. rotundata]